eukprot:NODE_4579_length_786_cov_988.447761_g3806_i0.p2 GENE.NODE_4579_length_786_cov_988.447761_g3806_i0~~NODE_4579_length_786_cov_988.447761_g3806_i0.p2  ORF type:complete len:217 (+),score=47.02 NODE_4579_length_786_cov_988.447761_g3806_i0:117-767(+)
MSFDANAAAAAAQYQNAGTQFQNAVPPTYYGGAGFDGAYGAPVSFNGGFPPAYPADPFAAAAVPAAFGSFGGADMPGVPRDAFGYGSFEGAGADGLERGLGGRLAAGGLGGGIGNWLGGGHNKIWSGAGGAVGGALAGDHAGGLPVAAGAGIGGALFKKHPFLGSAAGAFLGGRLMGGGHGRRDLGSFGAPGPYPGSFGGPAPYGSFGAPGCGPCY